ncbi:hypothetical protein, partial [Caballeronia sp. BR00000012568055]|uniref:hypothetical protein n=1 Tax=Caballeronia sp. BR00000012568055 TaxID=2918761 RepID=UPI0023F88CF1
PGESGLVQLIVMNSQFNDFSSAISTGTGIQDLQLIGNLFIVQPNTVSLNLQNTEATTIIGNTFEPQGVTNNNYGIVFQSYNYGASIVMGNSFYAMSNGIVLTASAKNVNVQSNAYYNTTNKVSNSCSTCIVGGGSM